MPPHALNSRLALVSVLLVAGIASSRAAPVEVAGTVTWVDAGGRTGSGVFQGTVDGATLTGSLYAGPDRLLVQGTLAGDGSVSGSATSTTNAQVLGFMGTRAATTFTGTYAVSGSAAGGAWAAPADRFPAPAGSAP